MSPLLASTLLLFPILAEAKDNCVSGDICLPANYSRLVRPYFDRPVEVRVDLDVLQILDVNDMEFTVSFSMYFGVRWEEPRLLTPEVKPGDEFYEPVDISFFEHLWVPDIYIYHLKEITSYEIFTPFAGLFVVNRSTILYSHEAHVTFYCPMRFEDFPLDKQVCLFHIGSYAFDSKSMRFEKELLQFFDSKKNIILDYNVEIVPLKEEDRTYVWLDIGNYSLTGFEIRLTRNYEKYLLNYFLPSGLFVVVSWASFLIPPEMVPGRMTLLVTLFLVLINIFNNITARSPNTESLTSISAWLLSCIFFVFGALAAYAGILFLKYIKAPDVAVGTKMIMSKPDSNGHVASASNSPQQQQLPPARKHENKLKNIDLACLFAFPSMFILFNLVFWPLYLL